MPEFVIHPPTLRELGNAFHDASGIHYVAYRQWAALDGLTMPESPPQLEGLRERTRQRQIQTSQTRQVASFDAAEISNLLATVEALEAHEEQRTAQGLPALVLDDGIITSKELENLGSGYDTFAGDLTQEMNRADGYTKYLTTYLATHGHRLDQQLPNVNADRHPDEYAHVSSEIQQLLNLASWQDAHHLFTDTLFAEHWDTSPVLTATAREPHAANALLSDPAKRHHLSEWTGASAGMYGKPHTDIKPQHAENLIRAATIDYTPTPQARQRAFTLTYAFLQDLATDQYDLQAGLGQHTDHILAEAFNTHQKQFMGGLIKPGEDLPDQAKKYWEEYAAEGQAPLTPKHKSFGHYVTDGLARIYNHDPGPDGRSPAQHITTAFAEHTFHHLDTHNSPGERNTAAHDVGYLNAALNDVIVTAHLNGEHLSHSLVVTQTAIWEAAKPWLEAAASNNPAAGMALASVKSGEAFLTAENIDQKTIDAIVDRTQDANTTMNKYVAPIELRLFHDAKITTAEINQIGETELDPRQKHPKAYHNYWDGFGHGKDRHGTLS